MSVKGDKVEVVVPSVTSSDSGQYNVTAENEAGSATKKVTVEVKPK